MEIVENATCRYCEQKKTTKEMHNSRMCKSCRYRRSLENVRKWREENPDRVRELARDSRRGRYHATRAQVIEVLGGSCVLCDFSDARALEIDHPGGGGTEERNRVDRVSYYLKIISGEITDAQLLCLNHHRIKTCDEATVRAKHRGRPPV